MRGSKGRCHLKGDYCSDRQSVQVPRPRAPHSEAFPFPPTLRPPPASKPPLLQPHGAEVLVKGAHPKEKLVHPQARGCQMNSSSSLFLVPLLL